MTAIFTAIFYQPLYNALVILINFLPWADAGILIILVTLIVRLILFPLSQKAIRTQLRLKEIAPELEAIKAKHKGDRQAELKETLALYKARDIHPFAGILPLLIQLPVIISLYSIFQSDAISKVDPNLLYSFVHVPDHSVKMLFLGFISLTATNFVFALLAAITQFIQGLIMVPKQLPQAADAKKSIAADFAKSMSFQSKYVMPIVIFFIAFAVSAAVSLYWIVSNILTIIQELYVRWHYKKYIRNR